MVGRCHLRVGRMKSRAPVATLSVSPRVAGFRGDSGPLSVPVLDARPTRRGEASRGARRAQAALALSTLLLATPAAASAGRAAAAVLSVSPTLVAGQTCSIALKKPYYRDADGDGYGTGAKLGSECFVNLPPNTALNATDCNDSNAALYQSGNYYRDADGDGYGNPGAYANCGPLAGYVTNNQDCDDASAAYRPGSMLSCGTGPCENSIESCINGVKQTCTPKAPTAEVCDDVDNNCDGAVDNVPPITCGQGACFRSIAACVRACYTTDGVFGCHNKPNLTTCAPGAPVAESCDSVDNDCDGYVDNNPGVAQNNTFTKPCGTPNGCSVVGKQVCQAGGAWSGCFECGGTATCQTAQCGEVSTRTCSAACVPTGTCQSVAERCNNCDDDGNNRIDEGLSCQPCDL